MSPNLRTIINTIDKFHSELKSLNEEKYSIENTKSGKIKYCFIGGHEKALKRVIRRTLYIKSVLIDLHKEKSIIKKYNL